MEFPHPSEISAARRRLAIVLTIAAVFIAAIVYVVWPEDPRLQGRHLTDWLQDYSSPLRNVDRRSELNGQTIAHNMQNADQVIKTAGTNSVPALLKLTTAHDSAPRQFLLGLVGHSPSLRSRFLSAREKHQLAQTGFVILKHDASNAAPALTALTKDKDPGIRFGALTSLFLVSEPDDESLIPLLVPFGHDPDIATRARAAHQMQWLLQLLTDDEAQKAGVYEAFPELRPSNRLRSKADSPASPSAPSN